MGTTYHNKPIVTDGLVFYVDAANKISYPRTGTIVTDIIGNTTGSLTGAGGSNNTPQWENINGGIFDFDGTDDYINYGNASYLNGLSNFTLSCWFKLNTAADNKTIVSDWYYNNTPFGHFGLETDDASGSTFGLRFFIKATSDGGSNWVKTSTILSENTWYNVVFTYNSGTVVCYVDGSSVSLTINGTIPTTLTNQDGDLSIGRFGGMLDRIWNGKINLIQIYNSTLSASEVFQNYNALKNRFI